MKKRFLFILLILIVTLSSAFIIFSIQKSYLCSSLSKEIKEAPIILLKEKASFENTLHFSEEEVNNLFKTIQPFIRAIRGNQYKEVRMSIRPATRVVNVSYPPGAWYLIPDEPRIFVFVIATIEEDWITDSKDEYYLYLNYDSKNKSFEFLDSEVRFTGRSVPDNLEKCALSLLRYHPDVIKFKMEHKNARFEHLRWRNSSLDKNISNDLLIADLKPRLGRGCQTFPYRQFIIDPWKMSVSYEEKRGSVCID